MNHALYQVSLKAIIKNEGGEILILQALDSASYAEFWDLPGGRIHDLEFYTPLLDTLRREIEEEVGKIEIEVNPRPVSLGRHLIEAKYTLDKLRDIPVIYIFFEAKYNSGEIILSSEHKEFKWLDPVSAVASEYFKSGILEGVKDCFNKTTK